MGLSVKRGVINLIEKDSLDTKPLYTYRDIIEAKQNKALSKAERIFRAELRLGV